MLQRMCVSKHTFTFLLAFFTFSCVDLTDITLDPPPGSGADASVTDVLDAGIRDTSDAVVDDLYCEGTVGGVSRRERVSFRTGPRALNPARGPYEQGLFVENLSESMYLTFLSPPNHFSFLGWEGSNALIFEHISTAGSGRWIVKHVDQISGWRIEASGVVERDGANSFSCSGSAAIEGTLVDIPDDYRVVGSAVLPGIVCQGISYGRPTIDRPTFLISGIHPTRTITPTTAIVVLQARNTQLYSSLTSSDLLTRFWEISNTEIAPGASEFSFAGLSDGPVGSTAYTVVLNRSTGRTTLTATGNSRSRREGNVGSPTVFSCTGSAELSVDVSE